MMKKTILSLLALLLFMPLSYVYSGNNSKALIKSSVKKNSESLGFLSKGGGSQVSYPSKGLYFNLTPSTTGIHNKDISGDENWTIKNGMNINIEAGYFAKFHPLIGYGIGLGFSSYSTEITTNPQIVNFADNDVDNDSYIRSVESSALSEELKISYFDIPVFLEFGNPNIDKIGFYGRIGVKLSFPISQKFTPSGSASYEGYYEQYNVNLYGIPELNFDSAKDIYNRNETSLSSVNVSALLSGGVTFPLSNYLILRAGANANFGLMEISGKKQSTEDFEKTKYDGDYSKLLESPAKAMTQSIGIEIGIIYNLRLQ